MSVMAMDGSVSGSRDMTQNWFWGISTGWTVGWMAGGTQTRVGLSEEKNKQ